MNKFLYIVSFTFISLASCISIDASQMIVMRHGQGTHNVARIYSSNPYHPNYMRSDLTPTGKEQVIETAHNLLKQGFNKDTIDLVVVSPLPRTMQTANILLEHGVFTIDKMVIDSRLQEPHMGDLEGNVGLQMSWMQMDHKSFGGETIEQMQARIADVYRSILAKGIKGNILVITHSVPGHFLIYHITGERCKLMTAEAKVISLYHKK